MDYPVLEIIPELKRVLLTQRIVIIQAPPGAGKSTIIPLQLIHEPWLRDKKIMMLEPRRLAARAVAKRMANLLGEDVGQTVGYRIRFEAVVSAATRIEVVTEGILTRMLQQDNALSEVGLVLFDEFHERSLQADLALALCYQSQQILSEDLRLGIMSATLDGAKISSLLDNAPIVTSLGKQFPVTIKYQAIDKNERLWISVTKAVRKTLREEAGDVLVFLPGVFEINKVAELLEAEGIDAVVAKLYGDLPLQQQQAAILPHAQGRRKIVLATSIAETSLTIEGVTIVIDSGYARVPRYDPRSGLTRLETIPVTRDAADQRAGRAGRLQAGVCYRLWPESTHQHLLPARTPEIAEADLSSLMLELAQWGTAEPGSLTWITAPPLGAVLQAKELLQQLGATADGKITPRGKAMAKLPTHPRIAHMLLMAKEAGSIHLAIDVAAVVEERDPMPDELSADLALRVEAFRKWRSGERVFGNGFDRIERIAASWCNLFKSEKSNEPPVSDHIGQILAEAYPERIARQTEKFSTRYKLANGRMAKLPDHDTLIQSTWIVIAQLDAGKTEGKIFSAAAVDEKFLWQKAADQDRVIWDREKGMVTALKERRIGGLVLASRPLENFSEEQRVSVLCEAIATEGLSMVGWNEQHAEWQARILSLKAWRPEQNWPDVRDEVLAASSKIWLAPFLGQVVRQNDFQRLDWHAILTSILPWELQAAAERLAPVRLAVPSGSQIKIVYSKEGTAPVMQVRLQEVFGLLETPSVNDGKINVVLHLLSPGYKPVQVTQDLKSFWQTAYHEVRKQLRMRYPKHHWPEDPWTAEAVRGIKRKT